MPFSGNHLKIFPTYYVKSKCLVLLNDSIVDLCKKAEQIDLNENNAMISRPVLENIAIKIRAKNAIVTEEKTEAFDGFVTINQKTNYKFISRPVFGFHEPMMKDIIPQNFYFKEKYDNI